MLRMLLLHASNAPKVAEQRIHVDLLRRSSSSALCGGGGVCVGGRLLLMLLLLLLLLLLWRLEGGEQGVQGRVVEAADHACQVGGHCCWCCCCGMGLLLLLLLLLRVLLVWVAGGGLMVVIGVVVGGWIGGLLRLGVVGWGLGLLAHDELGGHWGVDVLVEFEADAAAAGADEELDGDLALCLGAVVEVDDAMHAFRDLAL